MPATQPADPATAHPEAHDKDPFLSALGERVRLLRARRGLTRKALAKLADVSERHVANVETGVGNASIQFLRQLCVVLNCSLAEMTGDEAASSPDWLMIRETLRGRSDEELAKARAMLRELKQKNKDLEADLVRLASLNLSLENEAKVLKAIASSNVRALP